MTAIESDRCISTSYSSFVVHGDHEPLAHNFAALTISMIASKNTVMCTAMNYLVRLNYLVLPRLRVRIRSLVISIIQFPLFVE